MARGWAIFDTRTDRPVTVLTYSTKERAEATLRYYIARDEAGKMRTDLHGDAPFWEVRRAGTPE